MQNEKEQIFTEQELADYLKIELSDLVGLRSEIPYFLINDQIRFQKKDVEKWISENQRQVKVSEFKERAADLEQHGKKTALLKLLTEMKQENALDFRGYYKLGTLLLEQGEIESGLENLKQSVIINPRYAPTVKSLALWYKSKIESSNLEQPDSNTNEHLAEKYFSQLLELEPEDYDALSWFKDRSLSRADFSRARVYLEKLRRITPADLSLIMQLVKVLKNLEQFEEAIRLLNEAAVLDPEAVEVEALLGQLLLLKNMDTENN